MSAASTPTDHIAALIAELADQDASVRESVADALVALGGEAVPALVEAFRAARPSPQYMLLVRTLQRIGPAALGLVGAELESAQPQRDSRRWLDVLSGKGTAVLPIYTRALKHPAADVRSTALLGIARLESRALPAARDLVGMLDDPDHQVRRRVLHALAAIGAGAIPLLQEVRRDGPGRSRAAALECLAEIGGEAALSPQDRAAVDRLIRIKVLDDRPAPISCCFLSWIAVSTGEQDRLMDLLGLSEPRPVTFELGTNVADCDSHSHGGKDFERLSRVFVTPEIAGWTLVVGAWADPADPDRARDVLELCTRASREFGKAQAYWFSATNDGSAWLVAEHGVVLRRGSAIDDATDALLRLGEPLPAEDALLEGVDDEFDRDFLLMEFAPKLAERLSISPLSLRADTVCVGSGRLALTPIGVQHGTPPGALRF